MDRVVEMHLDSLLLELLWIIPGIVGAVSIIYVWYTSRKRAVLWTVMACFILSFVVQVLGAIGMWRSGLELWMTLGVVGDISPELLYEGWIRSWLPLTVSGASTVVLLGIAITARLRPPNVSSETTPKEVALWMVIPAVSVISLVLAGFVVEAIVDASETDPRLFPFIALSLGAHYVLAFAGVPYMIIWGISIKKWTRQVENERTWQLTVLFFVLAIFTLVFTALFFVSAGMDINPFLPSNG